MLMIVGGVLDPNIDRLVEVARRENHPFFDYRIPNGFNRPFHWNINDNFPFPNDITGVFMRQDVFAPMKHPDPHHAQLRAAAWFTAVEGWLLLNPHIKQINQNISRVAYNKPAMLHMARQYGLLIPETLVSNDLSHLQLLKANSRISKPINGGGYCEPLENHLSKMTGLENEEFTEYPTIIQSRLTGPEMRVFIIGEEVFAFDVSSPSLDYRVNQDAKLTQITPPQREAAILKQLMDAVGMNYGAADLKVNEQTGELIFLELNTMPMFAAFDIAANRQVSKAILKLLS